MPFVSRQLVVVFVVRREFFRKRVCANTLLHQPVICCRVSGSGNCKQLLLVNYSKCTKLSRRKLFISSHLLELQNTLPLEALNNSLKVAVTISVSHYVISHSNLIYNLCTEIPIPFYVYWVSKVFSKEWWSDWLPRIITINFILF